MENTKRIELVISQHLITAFVNADTSGLCTEDLNAMDQAISDYGPYFHVCMPDTSETWFKKCDLTGDWSDCQTVRVEVSK